jgi:hypothetical protein
LEIPESEENRKEIENIYKIAKSFPNVQRAMDTLRQESQRTPSKFNQNRSSPRHVTVKCQNYKINREP